MFKSSFLAYVFIILSSATSALAEISGRDLFGAGFSNGSFEKAPGLQWLEKDVNGNTKFTFQELDRTDTSVTLFDSSRGPSGVTIKLDLRTNRVMYSEDRGVSFRPLYNIERLSDNRRILVVGAGPKQPNLNVNWQSDFGTINWRNNYYDNPNKMLQGQLFERNGKWHFEGRWGRRDDSLPGGILNFIFSPDGKSFSGQYQATDGSMKNCNGRL